MNVAVQANYPMPTAATIHVPSHSVYAARYAATAVGAVDYPLDVSATAAEERDRQYQHLLEAEEKYNSNIKQ